MFDLGRTFLAAVERSPDAVAIVDGARRLSYAAWAREAADIAAGLGKLGLKRGDRLAVVLQNRLDMASLHWACQLAGVVVTPLNWRVKAEELDYCLADSEAKALVFDAVAAEAIAGATTAQNLPLVGLDDTPGAICRLTTPPARPGGRKACRAGIVPSAPRRSPMSRKTFTAAASGRLA